MKEVSPTGGSLAWLERQQGSFPVKKVNNNSAVLLFSCVACGLAALQAQHTNIRSPPDSEGDEN